MKNFTLWSLALVLGLVIWTVRPVSPAAASGPVHWSYEALEGPEHWGELSPEFALCSTGKEQTPIDVPSTAVVNPADIVFNYQPTALSIFNNGHTIQINYDQGSSIEVGGKTYHLRQFHFHTPSEHTVDSQPTDLEMHLVHQSDEGQLAVVGVMLKRGGENPAYTPVFDHLPAQEGEPAAIDGVAINANDLLPQERTYYRYNGSLTTPPCSEGVQWLLMNTPVELTEAQVSAFQQIFPQNARPIQPPNGRAFWQTSALVPATLPATGGVAFPIGEILFGLGMLTTLAGLYLRQRKGV